jgi:hypothetical protein
MSEPILWKVEEGFWASVWQNRRWQLGDQWVFSLLGGKRSANKQEDYGKLTFSNIKREIKSHPYRFFFRIAFINTFVIAELGIRQFFGRPLMTTHWSTTVPRSTKVRSEMRADLKSRAQKSSEVVGNDEAPVARPKRSEFRLVEKKEVVALPTRADRMVRSIRKSTQPATVLVDAEDFASLSEAQKEEYLIVARFNKALHVVVYNYRGQGGDKLFDALLKLDHVRRTEGGLAQAMASFGRTNVPAIHLSKNILPAPELMREMRRKIVFFKTRSEKSGTLAMALLWAFSVGEHARMIGVKQENGFWTVEEALLEHIQRTYEQNLVIAVAA